LSSVLVRLAGAALRVFDANLLEDVAQLLIRSLLERTDAQVGVARLQQLAVHTVELHDVAHHGKGSRLVEVFAQDVDRNLAALASPHQVHGFEQAHVLGAATVFGPILGTFGRADHHDAIARANPGAIRRRTIDR